MIAYALKRIALIIPTLFAIMVINFAIVQIAPGGPVEEMIARLKGTAVSATQQVSGGSGELRHPATSQTTAYRGAQGL
ncbi:MAG: microcin ABC transporter permease, partial [Acetobacteraceae bacterium]